MIERGRYCSPKIPREERLCQVCSKQVLEDEKHFIFDCALYDNERESLKLWFLDQKNVDLNRIDKVEKLEILFRSTDQETQSMMSKYIFNCVYKRKDYMKIGI